MYTYAAGSPKTYGHFGHCHGFGLVTHEQAQAQAKLDFIAKFGHDTPQNYEEASWLSDRTAALKAATGAEQEVVTRTVTVRPPGNVAGPLRIAEYQAALKFVPNPMIQAKINQAIALASQMTDAAVEQSERVYMEAHAMARLAGYPVPLLKDLTSTKTVTTGGGVPSAPQGTASVLKNLTESVLNIFKTTGATPTGPIPGLGPVGGVPYQPGVPVQTSAPGWAAQRIGPFTTGQLAVAGGVGLAAIALVRQMMPLAILGGVAAAGAWFMGRR